MFKQHQEEFEFYLRVGDTKEFIKSWSDIAEETVLGAGEVHELKERKTYKGHGEVSFGKERIPISGISNKDTNNVKPQLKFN